MSESIVRKVQPFTIGTRLSVPAVPKCPDFTQSYLQSQSLDNCALQQHNLNDRVTLYLSRSQARADGPRLAPPAKQRVTPVRHRQREDMADDDEDHLNRNAVSPNAVSRSIRKITISGSREAAGGMSRPAVGSVRPLVTSSPKSENINNNNNNFSSPDSLLPRIVGVSCENKPSSHFKVLLRKDSNDEQQANTAQRSTLLQLNKSSQQTSGPRARSPRKDQQRRESPPNTHRDGSTAAESQNDCFTQRNSLFNREILQAEAWIKGKLQDLRDGSNVQRCPLRDWEEVAQTLQRDLRDFENTLIQLNQMGEQLICKPNPTADLVRKQLSQLRDQWQTLKQTAANQTRALGGARNLQEFNKKVDKLEFWIKEKQEEEQSLAGILGENIDKLQLTRRVLDLKQDEQLYRNLHEEINHLAVKLEKQGKTEGKNISTRRKHINKMWLKVQSHLKDYHENLQLALEVSSFYQQAENTLFSIKNMRKSMSLSKDTESSGDREIRDIASQIMMLDVTVSQLSNLHPGLAARVTLKQGEVKECWAVLQRALRSERVPLAPGPPGPPAPAFTREDSDPLTPAREPQCSVGTPAHWIMGKEVKEEQNRLKGCGSAGDCGTAGAGKTPSSQRSAEDRRSPSHAPSSPRGDGPACEGGDVSARRQAEGESRKQRAELRSAAAPRGHPPLGAQLQKFTVSADKTLSWLKDNVAMATQVCSMTSTEGLEAAKRCQNILEQEILTNRARIEVVKKEGRGLVRAQHPGSVRIQEFLSQLEVLWDELRRRHQRNATVLQASEELGFRAVKVLQALGSLEAWLESVELSVRESSLSGDPATMSAAERESCLLEREVAARGLELRTLRREAERLGGQGHPHARQLSARMEEVERKYRSVQSALTQQSSELQDTRMLTEFLERVELEESQENRGGLELPLHSEISSAPALLGLQVGGGAAPLLQSMGDPVEELREAVEMLNDTVRERGRSQSHDQAVLDLLSRHASLTVRIEERLSRSRELIVDVLERETEMVVKCEPDRCGLEGLQEQQDHLEIDYKAIRADAEEMERLASRLEELCPERVHALGTEVRATLQTWAELGRSVAEGGGHLRQFVQLQDFFRSYLAMISWTEDTRSCIFSDSALYLGKEGQEPMAAELDLQIDLKFEEFEELAAAGAALLEAEHHLAEMIRERTEELRSMLGWILVHWRAQKQQWSLRRKRKEEEKEEEGEEEEAAATGDNIYSEATVCSPLREDSPPDSQQPSVASVCEDRPRPAAADGPPSALTSRLAYPATTSRLSDPQAEGRHDDGYEVMSRIGPWGGDVASAAAAAAPEGPSPPFLVLREPSSPALGGTVNLILSFGDGPDDGRAQLHEPCPRMDEEEQGVQSTEPLHRVSTYLHVKDNNMAAAPVYESITLPRLRGQTCPPAASNSASSSSSSSSPPSSPSSSSPAGGAAQISSVSFPSLPMWGGGGGSGGSNSTSIFSSLKRMSKKRKRKRDGRRHTIQRIMGVELAAEGPSVPERDSPPPPPAAYDTQTWPLKEARRRKKNAPKNTPGAGGAELTEYVRNPLAGDIDAECYSITPYAVSEGPPPAALLSPPGQVRSHCRFLSLGSVLTFDLPKDMSLIPSIQDVITIGEVRRGERTAADPHTDRTVTALSSFKQGRPPPSHKQNPPPEKVRGSTDWPGTQSQTHAIPPEAPSDPDDDAFPPPPPPAADEDQTVPCGDDLSAAPFACSGAVSLHEEPERGRGGRAAVGLVVPVAASGKPRPSAAVHTLDPDPNRHRRHPKTTRCGQRESPGVQRAQGPSQASHMVVNLKSGTVVAAAAREDSVDSGISSSGSLRLGADAPSSGTPEDPQPRGVVGRVISLEVGGLDCAKPRLIPPPAPPSAADAEPVHPDHQQFEEEEEELEDIWNHTNSYRQSICSDIMYQPHREEEEEEEEEEEGVGALPDRPRRDSPSPKPQAVLYRKLVTASAPNLLVAEFTLPSSVQCMLGYRKGESPHHRRDELPPPGKKDRRSWTAFPDREQPRRQPSAPVNETAADPVTLPEVEDQKIYIYQYREEEEEEEERGKEEEEKEDTGCPKDRSMSLLSVHMGPDGSAPRAAMHLDSQDEEREEQGLGLATGGRRNTLVQSMEGILDRKHRLQLGGKKAPSRAWGSYHAVLYRQTLGFYQDKKDTLRSSVCGLPLNLIGAECAPAPDYTKKPNCFSLRLRDGSEYLLSASSRLMMNKWMLEIQANAAPTGLSEPVTVMSSPSAQDLPITTSSSLSSSCLCLAKCHGSAHRDVTSSVPRRAHAGAARAQEIVVLSRESGRPAQGGPARQSDPPPSSPPHAGRGGETSGALTHGRYGSPRESSSLSPCAPASSSRDWTSHKQRSHSFTSATYQKIKPVPLPPGGRGRDGGSSYSVTLVIGDKPADAASAGESSDAPQLLGWQQDSALRSYASLPRPPRNKSVFKKFFGKKD